MYYYVRTVMKRLEYSLLTVFVWLESVPAEQITVICMFFHLSFCRLKPVVVSVELVLQNVM